MFWRVLLLLFATVVTVVLVTGSRPTEERTDDTTTDLHASDAHRAEVEAWHARRIESLRRPEGWLSLVGLFALRDGELRFGSGSDADLAAPADRPALIATFTVDGGEVTLSAAAGVDLRHAGEAVTRITMRSDAEGDPTTLEVDDLVFYVIDRDGRPYLRVKDRRAPLLQSFAGIDRWPVRAQWRVEGRWVAFAEPRLVRVPNIIGIVEEVLVPAAVEFDRNGRTHRLLPTAFDGSLFFVFGDATNGVESYGAGRFLYTELPDSNGRVVLDFNRSYNPPCVFTPFATCPLPPEDNTLDLAIEAGEKMWGEMH